MGLKLLRLFLALDPQSRWLRRLLAQENRKFVAGPIIKGNYFQWFPNKWSSVQAGSDPCVWRGFLLYMETLERSFLNKKELQTEWEMGSGKQINPFFDFWHLASSSFLVEPWGSPSVKYYNLQVGLTATCCFSTTDRQEKIQLTPTSDNKWDTKDQTHFKGSICLSLVVD